MDKNVQGHSTLFSERVPSLGKTEDTTPVIHNDVMNYLVQSVLDCTRPQSTSGYVSTTYSSMILLCQPVMTTEGEVQSKNPSPTSTQYVNDLLIIDFY